MDATYRTRIIAALAGGPLTYGDLNRVVVLLNVGVAHDDFRRDLFALVTAGRVIRAGTTPDGAAYIFALAN